MMIRDHRSPGRSRRTAAVTMAMAVALAAAAGSAAAADLAGTWRGHYQCAQGSTALTVTLDRAGDGWDGTFAFGPDAGNPGVPAGSFAIRVTMNGAELHAVPGDWIEAVPDYVTVGFDGRLSADGHEIDGTIQGPGCDALVMVRAPMAAPAPPPVQAKPPLRPPAPAAPAAPPGRGDPHAHG